MKHLHGMLAFGLLAACLMMNSDQGHGLTTIDDGADEPTSGGGTPAEDQAQVADTVDDTDQGDDGELGDDDGDDGELGDDGDGDGDE